MSRTTRRSSAPSSPEAVLLIRMRACSNPRPASTVTDSWSMTSGSSRSMIRWRASARRLSIASGAMNPTTPRRAMDNSALRPPVPDRTMATMTPATASSNRAARTRSTVHRWPAAASCKRRSVASMTPWVVTRRTCPWRAAVSGSMRRARSGTCEMTRRSSSSKTRRCVRGDGQSAYTADGDGRHGEQGADPGHHRSGSTIFLRVMPPSASRPTAIARMMRPFV